MASVGSLHTGDSIFQPSGNQGISLPSTNKAKRSFAEVFQENYTERKTYKESPSLIVLEDNRLVFDDERIADCSAIEFRRELSRYLNQTDWTDLFIGENFFSRTFLVGYLDSEVMVCPKRLKKYHDCLAKLDIAGFSEFMLSVISGSKVMQILNNQSMDLRENGRNFNGECIHRKIGELY